MSLVWVGVLAIGLIQQDHVHVVLDGLRCWGWVILSHLLIEVREDKNRICVSFFLVDFHSFNNLEILGGSALDFYVCWNL